MNKLATYISALALCCSFAQCSDYLNTSSPENTGDEFVTSSTSETFKILSWCYANYRQNCIMGAYRWNDPIGSDSEIYPEIGSLNNANARLLPELLSVNAGGSGFNGLYTTIARASKVAELVADKPAFQDAVAAGKVNDWTQLYGEALTMKAFCYFDLVKHYGDVPYGYENNNVEDYSLTSRFEIYDNLIEILKEAEALMYPLGEGGITAERFSKGFADALLGQIALYSGGYQTIRTDVPGLYGDVQYRHINYQIIGANDNWDWNTAAMQKLNVDETFDFLNPKAGINWQINKNNRAYASFSVAQKEPTRNNYTDGKAAEHPQAERLLDYELGYTFANSWLTAGANLYYMDYKDQLVLTGEQNEIGEPMAANVPNSYRMGVELMLGVKLGKYLRWDINGTLSKNRVQNFTELLYENEEKNPIEIKHGDTPIAFSPDLILNNLFSFNYKNLEAGLQSQYVSKQYMSNAKQDEHILDAYFVSNLNVAYRFKLAHTKSASVGFTIYNLFNEEYENNGYAGSGYYMDNNQAIRYNYAGYAAQAGTNVMANLTLRF